MKRQTRTQSPNTPRGQQTFHSRQSAESTHATQGDATARTQWLWDDLPHELAQKIVWHRAPLPGMGQACAPATRVELFRSLMVDRKLRHATQPLLRLARWSHELSKCWPRPPNAPSATWPAPDIETLVSDAVAPGGSAGSMALAIPLPQDAGGQARADLLLSPLNAYVQSPFLAPLLTRLFEAWLERRQNAGPHTLRLPLDDLPQRLLHTDPLLTPPHIFEAINTSSSCLPMANVASAPVQLLMQHFAHFDKDFQRTLALHLLLLLEDDDLEIAPSTWAALKQHGIEGHEMVVQAIHWKSSLLDTPAGLIDVRRARDVLDVLKRSSLLSSLANLALLVRLCAVPQLRALESDEVWLALIQRVMAEIRHQRPAVWTDTLRADYLVARLPEDLGVAAFNRLPAAQRLRFIRKPLCGLYFKARIHMPYLRALAKAQDITPAERLATLDHFIRGVNACGAYEASALPQLNGWRQGVIDEAAGQAPV